MRTAHFILVLVSSGVILCRQIACHAFEFSPSSFPYATAPYNFEAMAAGAKNKGATQVKLLGVKKGTGASLPNKASAASPTSPRCTLELQVVQRINGFCVDFGRSNACNAGTYIYPFHPDCTMMENSRSRGIRS